ncbi:DUF1501 domain-containing protein [Zavarzinia compransoris]|uniref:DUF1501 domain-containing protein n=1 Tax=Zavarzinia marina TaxID=2911065 RepID=UPI001F262AAE|nr:DUF1501 domain-containing protein [Zavarzinia marina]MCF4165196.1 DUF1501 domain-containing protein [Zavarzinia marina]
MAERAQSLETDRRRLLAGAGGAALALGLGGRVALALVPGDRRLIVFVLRGALDGLSAVPPHGDRDYARVRGDLALAAPGRDGGMLDLDGFHGLHPALSPLMDLWRAGEMQILHATATPYRERSHFDAQNVLETGGDTPSGSADGWLNRAVALAGGSGLAGGLAVPLVLSGSAPVTTWAPQVMPLPDVTLLDQLAVLYGGDALLAPALEAARAATAVTGGGAMGMGKGAASLAPLVGGVARLMKAADGPRVATIDVQGFDTHTYQGTGNGRLARALAPLGAAIMQCRDELGAAVWGRTLVLAITEFGRTVAPNGTGGTDHGTAGVAFACGGALSAAKVHGQWPGLARDRLYQGRDLAPTTDLRALFMAVLTGHMGLPAAEVARRVFPEAAGLRPLDLILKA